MKLIVLAAGFATRLSPLTDHCAKALLPIRGRLILEHLLDRFVSAHSVDAVYVVSNDVFAEDFEAFCVDRTHRYPRWRLRVVNNRVTRNETRKGAVGDLFSVCQLKKIDEDVIVVAGDNLFVDGEARSNINEFVTLAERTLDYYDAPLVGTYRLGSLADVRKYGEVQIATDRVNLITEFREKPDSPVSPHISTGLYFFPRHTLSFIQHYVSHTSNLDNMGHFLQWLVRRVACYAFPVRGRWFDIGDLMSYQEAQHVPDASRTHDFAVRCARDVQEAIAIRSAMAAGQPVPVKPCSYCTRDTRMIFSDDTACCPAKSCLDASSKRCRGN